MVTKPATYAARAAATAASSWVRREPISMHGRSPAAQVIRDAADAIAESWLRIDSSTRLEQHRLGERRLDDHQRGVGEVGLALGVAPDVAGEPVAGQPLQGRLVDHLVLAEHVDHVGVEAEPLDRVEGPSDAGHHAVPAALGQPAREQLEDRPPVGGAGGAARPAAW